MAPHPELRPKTWPYYWPSYEGRLSAEGCKLLQDCGVAAENMHAHIHNVRDQAWEVYPFPCVAEFWFLEFGITHHPRMHDIVALLQACQRPSEPANGKPSTADTVVDRIRKQPTARRLLDLGTCVGQDLRALRDIGVPTSALYGSDLFPGFEAVGHALFLDKTAFPQNFFTADIFDDSLEAPLKQTAGLWDVLSMTMFLHQFDEQSGLEIATCVIALLKPVPGSMVVGYNTGETVARETPMVPQFGNDSKTKMVARYSQDSMRAMWEKAVERNKRGSGSAEGSPRRDVWCEYYGEFARRLEAETDKELAEEKRFFEGGEQRRIMFCVRRLR